LEKALTFLDDSLLGSTSNAVEHRANSPRLASAAPPSSFPVAPRASDSNGEKTNDLQDDSILPERRAQ
jgi:hypothetical protein